MLILKWQCHACAQHHDCTPKHSLHVSVTYRCDGVMTQSAMVPRSSCTSTVTKQIKIANKIKQIKHLWFGFHAYSTVVQWFSGVGPHNPLMAYAIAAWGVKMWCSRLRTNPLRFSPAGSVLVSRSASLSCVLMYEVRHSSLAEPSLT
jgi:hypothetical protein